MRPMLFKEFLAARPQLVSIAVIGVVLLVSDLVGTAALEGMAGLVAAGSEGLLLFAGGLAFALGHGQIGPEVTQGHVEFLDGLPVTRARIFAVKVFVGLMTVILLVAAAASAKLLVTEWAWGASALETLSTVFAALAVGVFAFYASGLLFSWFGGFGWAMLAVGLTVTMIVAELFWTFRPLSVFHGYGSVRFEANVPIIELWPLGFWGVYGVFCCTLCGLVFVGRGDRLLQAGSALGRAVRGVLLVAVVGLLVLAAVATGAQLAARAANEAGAPRIAQAGTFRVLIPARARGAATDALLLRMPRLDTDVRSLLGAPAPLTLDVEFAPPGRFHAGVYTGGKIRMALGEDPALVFAHELSHAYVDALGKGNLRRHHNALRFFNEGLAVWTAERVVKDVDEANAFRAWAGALYKMGHHPLDLLMDDRVRALSFDPFEPYPLGLVFIDALVEAYGTQGVRCVARQAGTLPDEKLVGVAVWARLAQGCGIDFTKLVAAYESLLAAYGQRWPMPPPPERGQPVWQEGALYLALPQRGSVDASVGDLIEVAAAPRRCRFRSSLAASPADLDESVETGGRCAVRSIIGATNTVSFQIGVRLPDGWTAYGRWVQQPVPAPTDVP